MVEKGLKVKLQARDGVLEFEVAHNFGVQDTDHSDLLSVHHDGGTAASEESGVILLLDKLVILEHLGADFSHKQIQKTVNDLEVSSLVADHS
jgi:hypothetical protein